MKNCYLNRNLRHISSRCWADWEHTECSEEQKSIEDIVLTFDQRSILGYSLSIDFYWKYCIISIALEDMMSHMLHQLQRIHQCMHYRSLHQEIRSQYI